MSSLHPSMLGPSSLLKYDLEKMFVNFDWRTYRLSVGITPKDIEEDAHSRALRCVSGYDADASSFR